MILKLFTMLLMVAISSCAYLEAPFDPIRLESRLVASHSFDYSTLSKTHYASYSTTNDGKLIRIEIKTAGFDHTLTKIDAYVGTEKKGVKGHIDGEQFFPNNFKLYETNFGYYDLTIQGGDGAEAWSSTFKFGM